MKKRKDKMIMDFVNENGVLMICLEGRLSTTEASQVESDIMKIINDVNPEKIIIDAKKLVYISSSGLRILMKIAKVYKNFVVKNASPEVYDIFDVTGFTDMITIEKAHRIVDIDGLDVLRRDNDGVVYSLSDDRILKIYNQNCNEEYVNKDKETVNKLLRADLPVMIASETVQTVDGRIGVIFIK